MINMFVNGIVIQSCVDDTYQGIDGYGIRTGENWFLNSDESTAEIFEPYYDEYIGRTYWDMPSHSWVAACNDMDYIYKYVEEAEKRHIKYRLLLCETEVPEPRFVCPDLKKKFLGYDYAYASGDNYSAVYNEIPDVFPQFRLNQYGLFQTKEEIDEYIAARELFKQTHPPLTLEEGDFVIFRLHEVYLK